MFGSQPLIPILTSVSTSTSNPVFDSVLESKGSDSNQGTYIHTYLCNEVIGLICRDHDDI